jgi:hypothetical protein
MRMVRFMVVPMILLFVILSVVEISILVRKKYIRDIFIFLILMAIALIYSISGVSDWYFPGPSSLPETLFNPLSRLVFPNHGE